MSTEALNRNDPLKGYSGLFCLRCVRNMFLGITAIDYPFIYLFISSLVETNIGGSNRACRDHGEGKLQPDGHSDPQLRNYLLKCSGHTAFWKTY
jgi:hypothetical protein